VRTRACRGESCAELDTPLLDNGIQLGASTNQLRVCVCADWKVARCVVGRAAAEATIYCPRCLGTEDESARGMGAPSAAALRKGVWEET
jgi:hypothetical protein